MRINTNIPAMNTQRMLNINNNNVAASTRKLSSGLRINSAADDAAGLSISEKQRTQVRGLNQASRNAQDGISLIQVAEGALDTTHAILQRMNELATQAANDSNVLADRESIQGEMNSLSAEIDKIAKTTTFNTLQLLDGSYDGSDMSTKVLRLQVGAVVRSEEGTPTVNTLDVDTEYNRVKTDDFEVMGVIIGDCRSAALSLDEGVNGGPFTVSPLRTTDSSEDGDPSTVIEIKGAGVNLENIKLSTDGEVNHDQARTVMHNVQSAIQYVSGQRSRLGAYQNRLEYSIKNLDNTAENTAASESRIRDVDMAKEMMTLSKNNVLAQAANAMLAQANQSPQNVLSLLR